LSPAFAGVDSKPEPLEVERELAMVLDREQVDLIATHRVQHQVISRDILAESSISEALQQFPVLLQSFRVARRSSQYISPQVRMVFEIRDNRIE
jgi:hypothetical protein